MNKLEPFEVESALESISILVDTREQLNEKFYERTELFGVPFLRKKLDFGDYSVKCDLLTLEGKIGIERKMNLDELALCFGSQRKRFEAEFERAKKAGAKLYLLCENASWDILYDPIAYKRYCHSRYSAKAMIASLTAWQARYRMSVVFCNTSNSGKLIHEILYRELKEALSGQGTDVV